MMWLPVNNTFGVVVHNWTGNVKFGLPLDIGDSVEIFEESTNWYRGSCLRKPLGMGIFPKSYVHIRDTSKIDPVVTECTQVLKEWAEIWKKLFVERESYKFATLRKVMLNLLEYRREILGGTLTQEQTHEIQMKIVSKIDWGNRKLNLDMVPRIGPFAIEPKEHGIVELYQVHLNSDENTRNATHRGTIHRKRNKANLTHHLYFSMRDFDHRLDDNVEIYFYLYDHTRQKLVSDRFRIRVSKEGYNNYSEKLNSNCSVFSDLGVADLQTELYLVACVIRIGKMLPSDTVKKGEKGQVFHSYRRPLGIGVLNITDLKLPDNMIESEEKEYNFKIFQCDERDFYQLHDLIIKKVTGKFSQLNSSNQSYGLVVALKLLQGGLLQAKSEEPKLFKETIVTKKIGFPDIIIPGDVRNDLFCTIDKGEFERGGKSSAKNILVTLQVYDSTGCLLTECVYDSSGPKSLNAYKSYILYHNNSPNWNETVRLTVPIDRFSIAHIRFEFRHCSTREKSEPKLFGFSFVRLMEPSGATLSDGDHELFVYKCEDPTKLLGMDYLKLPSYQNDQQSQVNTLSLFSRSSKEAFYIKSQLCSTKLTQNSDLLSLLQWKAHPEKISDSLTRILKVQDEELIKFLQDILDALFAMFSNEDGNSTEHSGAVFNVLVSILSLLKNKRFQHFKPVIDIYIENHFAAALVYKGLMSSVNHLAEWILSTDKPDPFRKCFDSIEFIFKFIIQSRKLFAQASGGRLEDSFKRDLYSLFQSLNRMLAVPTTDVILPMQESLLASLNVILMQLRGVISYTELAALTRNMFESIPRSSETQSKLIEAKLNALKHIASSELFHEEEYRQIFLNIICKQVNNHLATPDEIKLSSDILMVILKDLYIMRNDNQYKAMVETNIDILCKNLITSLVKTIISVMDGSVGLLSALVPTLGIFELLEDCHYENLFKEFAINYDTDELKTFLHQTLLVFHELLMQNWHVYQRDWILMKLASNDVLKRTLEHFAEPLAYRYIRDFDVNIWFSYFNLSVAFVTQPCLQLEEANEMKRHKILRSYGDMRVSMGFQILSMWSQLNEHKLHFVPMIIGPFLELTLVPETNLRKATLVIFYDIMQIQQISKGSCKMIENEIIDKLDVLINEYKGDEEYKILFSEILLDHVMQEKPKWKDSATALIISITKLLELLLDYRSVMQGDENRDKRMSCTVNLLNFYKDEINRKELYVKYIYKLLELHLQAENFVEAGFTLKLYADMLSWTSNTQGTSEPEWRRKQKLYNEILQYFDKGKCWEKGIPLCKELAYFYETLYYDYIQLSIILRKEAEFFENIRTQIRPEPEYFRVGFYGNEFPLFVRNKQFIYRGIEYERIGAFTQRLQTEFPNAQIWTKNHAPDRNIIGQYLQISNVRPLPDQNNLKGSLLPKPKNIARFYEVNDITRFVFDRPVHKEPIDKENEFKSLWLERTVFKIEFPLPGILRWFEVVDKRTEEITPVQFACETMTNVAKELVDLINEYDMHRQKNINPFSMRLQGIIDANVMGGISKYLDAFFTEEFLNSKLGKEQKSYVIRLKCLITEQLQILAKALDLHGQLAPVEVQPLHNRLVERFSQLQQTLQILGNIKKQYFDSIINTPLPPLPSTTNHVQNNHNNFDNDDIYESSFHLKPHVTESNLNKFNGNSSCCETDSAPPIPHRPKSAYSFNEDGYSPQIPLKSVKYRQDSDAPPLPPRSSCAQRFKQTISNASTIDFNSSFSNDKELNGENGNEASDGVWTESPPPPLPYKNPTTSQTMNSLEYIATENVEEDQELISNYKSE